MYDFIVEPFQKLISFSDRVKLSEKQSLGEAINSHLERLDFLPGDPLVYISIISITLFLMGLLLLKVKVEQFKQSRADRESKKRMDQLKHLQKRDCGKKFDMDSVER